MSIKIVLTALVLLIPGRSSAMKDTPLGDLGQKIAQILSENKSMVTGVTGLIFGAGGTGLLCAFNNMLKKSRDKKSEKIALLVQKLRAKLEINEEDKFPKDAVELLSKKAYNEGFNAGWDEAFKESGDALKNVKMICSKGYSKKNWGIECCGNRSAITRFLGEHPGHEKEEKETMRGDSLLEALHGKSEILGMATAKEVFEGGSDDPTKGALFKMYLSAQRSLLLKECKEKITAAKNDLKLLIAKKLIKTYSGNAPSGDFGEWFTQTFKKYYVSKLFVATKFDPNYSGGVYPGDFGKWFDRQLENYCKGRKKKKRALFGRKKKEKIKISHHVKKQ